MTYWMIRYRIDGRWQDDGEWWTTKGAASEQATQNARDFGWDAQIIPVVRRGRRGVARIDGKALYQPRTRREIPAGHGGS